MSDQQQVPEQSQSQPGPTGENPNADRDNGTQSTIQPGGEGREAPGGEPTGGPSTAGDGGNPAANQGGANGEGAPAGGGNA